MLFTLAASLSLSANSEDYDEVLSDLKHLNVSYPSDSNEPLFNAKENYQKLMHAYHHARTQNAYDNAIHAVYTFVEQHLNDLYSVDLLNGVAIFFPTWEADVNIPLYRKIVQTPNHPENIYKAHMTLYFYGEKADKDFALCNFKIIADDEKHSCQKDAQEFLDSIGKDWDKD